MQSVWSRAAPPQSTCRCVSCWRTAVNGISSRTTTAASRRRLRVGNSVTALYSSIFAAATLADAQAKDKRRHEWEEKIAAVKEEVNGLVDEEKRIITALSSRGKSGALNRPLQLRQYSTSRSTPPVTEQLDSGPRWPSQSVADKVSTNKGLEFDNNSGFRGSFTDGPELDQDDLAVEYDFEDWGSDPLRMRAIQKLALKQLAIRFLLRPVVAHAYGGVKRDIPPDFEMPRLKASELLMELDDIGRRIGYLKRAPNVRFDDVADLNVRKFYGNLEKDRKLDEDLERDVALYMRNTMSLPVLLLKLSNNLVSSNEPERPKAFRSMMIAFSATRHNDLADLLMRTLIPQRFKLSSPLILAILNYFRKSKNLKDFDIFLEILRGNGKHKANLGTLSPYKLKVVNGMELTVPPLDSNNYLVWSSLVLAALRFDQPDRADAWLQTARSHGFTDDYVTLFSYLKFCRIRRDWERGVRVLKRALAFITSSTDLSEARVGRMIVLMVHLCDHCEQYEFSKALIDAAVRSGFDWNIAEKQLDLTFPSDPTYKRWQDAADLQAREYVTRETWEKCHSFTSDIKKQLDSLLAVAEEKAAKRRAMDGQYSENILSSAYAEFDDKRRSTNADGSLPENVDLDGSESGGISTSSKAQNGEITALRAEVAQLKQLVFQLHRKEPLDPNAAPTTTNINSTATVGTDPVVTDSDHKTVDAVPSAAAVKPPTEPVNKLLSTSESKETTGDGTVYPPVQDRVSVPTTSPTSVFFKKKPAFANASNPVQPNITVRFMKHDEQYWR